MNKFSNLIIMIFIILFWSCKDKHIDELKYKYQKLDCEIDSKMEIGTYRPELDYIEGYDTIEGLELPRNRYVNYFYNCEYYYRKDTLIIDFGEAIRGEETMIIKALNDNVVYFDYKMPLFNMENLYIPSNLLYFDLFVDTINSGEDTIHVNLEMKADWKQDIFGEKNVKTFMVINDCSYCVLKKF